MWCFIVTPSGFEVFDVALGYVAKSGFRAADTFKEALDGVLDIVRRAYSGLDVSVEITWSSFDRNGDLRGVVEVRLPSDGGDCFGVE